MMVSAREGEGMVDAVDIETELDAEFEIQPRGLLKRLLPRTMFGRSLLIVVVPLILLQAIATWVFYDRHWAAVSWRLSEGGGGGVRLLYEGRKPPAPPTGTGRARETGAPLQGPPFTFHREP